MEKGFNLKVADLEQDIVNIINDSGLPLFVTKSVLESLYNQCSTRLQEKIAIERKEYEESKKVGDE